MAIFIICFCAFDAYALLRCFDHNVPSSYEFTRHYSYATVPFVRYGTIPSLVRLTTPTTTCSQLLQIWRRHLALRLQTPTVDYNVIFMYSAWISRNVYSLLASSIIQIFVVGRHLHSRIGWSTQPDFEARWERVEHTYLSNWSSPLT